MTLREYQEKAMATCMPSCDNLPYMLFNLQGEVGELSSKVAKAIRKGHLNFDFGSTIWFGDTDKGEDVASENIIPSEYHDPIKGELGDVLWQLSGVCSVLGYELEDIAQSNIAKLASRKQRGVIDGNGDNR